MKNYYTDALFRRGDYERLGKYLKYYVEMEDFSPVIPRYIMTYYINPKTSSICRMTVILEEIKGWNNTYFFVRVNNSIWCVVDKDSWENLEASITGRLEDMIENDLNIKGYKKIYIEHE